MFDYCERCNEPGSRVKLLGFLEGGLCSRCQREFDKREDVNELIIRKFELDLLLEAATRANQRDIIIHFIGGYTLWRKQALDTILEYLEVKYGLKPKETINNVR